MTSDNILAVSHKSQTITTYVC